MPDWRAAFGELLVFEQDFDTAMQILMFQDEKVARLSLQEPSQEPSQTRSQSARSRRSSARSPSRKRRRTGTSQTWRPEPPNSPLTGYTQDSHGLSLSVSVSVEEEATQEPPTQESRPPSLEAEIKDTQQSAVDDARRHEQSVAAGTDRISTVVSAAGTGAAVPSGGAVPSLFTTGSGKTVSVSAVRLRAYEEKLLRDEEGSAAGSSSTVVSAAGTGAAVPSGGAVPSLFTTGSGKTVSVSAVRLRAYEEKLLRDEEGSVAGSSSTVVSTAGTSGVVPSGGAVPSLFTTGSGKTVSVSAVRLRAYEEKLLRDEEGSAAGSSSTVVSAAGTVGAVPSGGAVPSLFTTGSGKTVSVSAVRLRAYEEKLLRDEEGSVAGSSSTVVSTAGTSGVVPSGGVVPSLFTTGSGKTVSVSAVRLRAYEEKLLRDEEGSVAGSSSTVVSTAGTSGVVPSGGAVPSLFTTGSGKTVSVSAVRLRAYEEKLLRDEEGSVAGSSSTVVSTAGTSGVVPSGGVVPSLFTTGSGKTVSVSAVRLRAYEEKLLRDEEGSAAGSSSTVVSTAGTSGVVPSGGVMPSLFTTGSGKTVSVSAVRLRAYEEKLLRDEEGSAAGSSSTVVSAAGTVGAVPSGGAVPSLFTTGSGKTVSVSAVRLRAYEEKLLRDEEGSVAGSSSTVVSTAGTSGVVPSGGVVPSLFTTGSGKTVSVSAVRLRAYEEKLLRDEEGSVAGSSSTVVSTAGTSGVVPSGGAVPSLFTTGSGKTVSVSAVRLRAYEEKLLRDEEGSAAGSSSTVVSAAGTVGAVPSGGAVPSLFTTGSGKTVSVSAVRLRAYEEKLLRDEEGSVAGSSSTVVSTAGTSGVVPSGGVVPSLFTTGSGKTVSVSAVRLRAYEEKLLRDEEGSVAGSSSTVVSTAGTSGVVPSGGAVPSLFTTGSGKTVSVSAVRLRAYEEKLLRDEEGSVAGSSSTVVSAAGTSGVVPSGGVVPSLFTTGSGKTVSVSAVRLRAYEEKLLRDEEGSVAGSSSTVVSTAGTSGVVPSGGAVPSLFTTGSGKTVSVSAVRLRAYEEKLLRDEEGSAAGSSSTVVSAAGTGAAVPSGGAVPSLFTTGSGKTVSVSAVRLRAYEEKLLRDEEGSAAGSSSTVVSAAGTVGAVHSGGARNAEEKRWNEEEALISCLAPVDGEAGVFDDGDHILDNFSRSPGLKSGTVKRKVLSGVSGTSPIRKRRRAALNDLDVGDRDKDASAFLDRSQRLTHVQLRGIDCGDKENVHPEDALAQKTAALEASKSWRSKLCSKQARTTGRRTYPRYQVTQPQKAARPMKPSIEPRSKMIEKRRFHPPVASKKTNHNDRKQMLDVGRPAPPRRKKQKVAGTEAQPFVYKEAMKISLPALIELNESHSLGDGDYDELPRLQVLNEISAETSLNVRFTCDGGVICSTAASSDTRLSTGPRELYCQLREGQYILVAMGATYEWFLNQYRWIVWKLAAMERSFPRLLLNRYLTKAQVLKQISHRYQRDLNDAQRSIVKKILQRDASSLSCMVLCVAAALPFPADTNAAMDQELPPCWNMALVLTDGWYSVYAVPDAPLAAVMWKLHGKSSLVGTKLAIWNASLQNSTEGIDPLECAIVRESPWKTPLMAKEDITQWPYLQLRYNSTRRVRLDTRLGVERLHYVTPKSAGHRKQQPQLTFSLLKSVPLKSLEVGGGMVRSVRVRVTRISPVLHLQAKEWTLGPRILCEEQLPLYFQLRDEYARMAMEKKHPNGTSRRVDEWSGEEQIDVPPPIPFIKVDVECSHSPANADQGIGCGILTIWRPSEELLSGGLKEGSEYFASSLTVNWKLDGGRGQDAFLRLSSTKHSGFEQVHDQVSMADTDTQDARTRRVCVDIQEATTDYRTNFENGLNGRRNECRSTIDVCVCVVLVATRETQDESTSSVKRQAELSLLDPVLKPKESRYAEHVFVTDQSCHLMSIRVSGMEVNMPKKKSSPLKRASSSSFVFRRGSKNIWKQGAVVCLSGLEVSHYDEQLRVLDCVLVESTQIVSFPSKRSLFWDPFQSLKRESGLSTKRGSDVPPVSSDFGSELTQLKKYVERDILKLDFVSSQECDEHHVEVVEQERLTQDLQAHVEGGESTTAEQRDEAPGMPNRLLRWDASVIKVLPLLGTSRFVFPRDVIAFACVNIRTDDRAFRTVYLTREAVESMRNQLQEAGAPQAAQAENATVTALVQSVTQMLDANKEQHSGNVFHFEVRQSTNERLMNSWKPWERLHASYWLGAVVTAPASE